MLTNSCIGLVLGFSLVGVVGVGWGGVGCGGVGVGLCGVRSRELGAGCAPHLPRFILLVSFSDTLLVVAILGIVYDCRLRPLLQF